MDILDFYNENGEFFLFEESDNEFERLGKEKIESEILENAYLLEDDDSALIAKAGKSLVKIMTKKIEVLKKMDSTAKVDIKTARKLAKATGKEYTKLSPYKNDPEKLVKKAVSMNLFKMLPAYTLGGAAVGGAAQGISSSMNTARGLKELDNDYRKEGKKRLTKNFKMNSIKEKSVQGAKIGAVSGAVGSTLGAAAGLTIKITAGAKSKEAQAMARKYFQIVTAMANKYKKYVK